MTLLKGCALPKTKQDQIYHCGILYSTWSPSLFLSYKRPPLDSSRGGLNDQFLIVQMVVSIEEYRAEWFYIRNAGTQLFRTFLCKIMQTPTCLTKGHDFVITKSVDSVNQKVR